MQAVKETVSDAFWDVTPKHNSYLRHSPSSTYEIRTPQRRFFPDKILTNRGDLRLAATRT
jgi:hypothetical protein